VAVSGVGVALATAGGVLLYAGLKGENPLTALRDIAAGHPAGPSTAPGITAGAAAPAQAAPVQGPSASGFGPALVAAARSHRMDRYSQLQRNSAGFSDCSSFVGKSLRDIGVTPPGSSTTGDYLAWSALYKVPAADTVPGDLLANSAHMAVVTGPGTAIGQQNPLRNVAEGTFASIMSGTGAYLCLRYGKAR
jgi:cell wall-associated NlpC family hydrolase